MQACGPKRRLLHSVPALAFLVLSSFPRRTMSMLDSIRRLFAKDDEDAAARRPASAGSAAAAAASAPPREESEAKRHRGESTAVTRHHTQVRPHNDNDLQ